MVLQHEHGQRRALHAVCVGHFGVRGMRLLQLQRSALQLVQKHADVQLLSGGQLPHVPLRERHCGQQLSNVALEEYLG